MENPDEKKSNTLVIVVVVLGSCVALFTLMLVVPAILFLSRSETSHPLRAEVHTLGTEISIPQGDGSEAPDFFDDLESK